MEIYQKCIDLISVRECEVLQLISNEYSTKEIAEELCISYDTVKTHRKNLMEKLGVRNAAGLVREGFRLGIISLAKIASLILLFIVVDSNVLGAQNTVLNDREKKSVWRTRTFSVGLAGDSNRRPTFIFEACLEDSNSSD